MSSDPVALLAELDLAVEPRTAFAAQLRFRLLAELERPARSFARTALIAAVLLLLLGGVATATYLAIQGRTTARPATGVLTLVSPHTKSDEIIAVLPGGRTRVVWHCPRQVFCGDLNSIDWSNDGRRLAFALGELGGRSAYVGLHILDIQTGRDLHIPSVALEHPLSPNQPRSVLERAFAQLVARLGCPDPGDLAWSPNGRRLAYSCRPFANSLGPKTRIYTIRRDGTGRRLLRTGTADAYSPSWSPDGKRIAFATWRKPIETIRYDTEKPAIVRRSSLYVVAVDGSGRKLLARDAATPDWSPDGRAIAYDSRTGVKLISPRGVDLSPAAGELHGAIAPAGAPAWSPDGTRISVQSSEGVLLVDTRDWVQTPLTKLTGGGIFGDARPAWYPGRAAPVVRGISNARAGCTPCL